MKNIFSHLTKPITLLLLLVTGLQVNAQDSNFNYTIANDVQVTDRILEFDLYLLDTDPGQPFELAAIQAGILVNPGIYNGGTITLAIVPGSSQLNTSQQPTSVIWTQGQNCIKLTPKSPPGAGSGTIISQTAPGTKVCRLRITNTNPFTSGSVANLTFNFTTSPYPTKVAQYIGTTNTELACNTSNCFSNADNIVLNPSAPTAFNVTGGGSYCDGEDGVVIGLDGSEVGVTYTLYKNNVAQTPTMEGTGSPLDFGDQLAGTYKVTGTNVTGTTDMNGEAVITNITPVTPTASVIVQPTCAIPTGTIVVSAPLGAIYEYAVDGGTYQSGTTFTGVAPGNHTVTARLAASPTCISSPTGILIVNAVPAVPPAPTASVTVQPTCAIPTGTIVVSGPLGAAYEYNIDGGTYQTSTTFSGLAPGGHTLRTRLTASPTCISSLTIPLTVDAVPTAPNTPVASVTVQPTCAVPTGTIVVTAPLGASYQYAVDGGTYQASATFTGVAPGGHTVTARLTASPTCISSPTSALTVNAAPGVPVTPTASVTVQPTCAIPTGTIVVSAPLGAIYEYAVDGGTYQSGTTFTGVAPGNHTVTARLAASPTCISSPTGILTVNAVPAVPPAPTASVTVQPTCAIPTGTIVVSGPLGAAYEYNIDGGTYQTSTTFSGLAPGGHTLRTRLTASPTCISSLTIPLTVDAVPTAPNTPVASVTVQPTCAVPTGTIVVTAPLGASYQYAVDGGTYQASATFTGVAPGGHTVTARLTASPTCISSPTSALTVNAAPGVPVTPTASVTVQPTCAIPTGTIVVSAPLGAIYEYAVDGGTYQSGTTFTGVAPGNHTVTARLAASPTCISSPTGILIVNAVPAVPPAPTASVTVQPTCAIPTGTIVVSGPLGAAYEYNIDGGTYQTSTTFSGLAPGGHTLRTRLTASPTCISSLTIPLTVDAVPTAPNTPVASVTVQPTCAVPTGTIVVTSPLGATYQYAVDGGTYQSGTTFTGVAPGNHTVTARLAASPTCISSPTSPLTVNAAPGVPSAPSANVTIQPTCNVSTGTIVVTSPLGATYEYSLDGGTFQVSTTFSGVDPGNHTIRTRLAASPTCISANSIVLTVNEQPLTPTAPLIGIITQPTCLLSTGSVLLNGLPAAGWTITRTPGGTTYRNRNQYNNKRTDCLNIIYFHSNQFKWMHISTVGECRYFSSTFDTYSSNSRNDHSADVYCFHR